MVEIIIIGICDNEEILMGLKTNHEDVLKATITIKRNGGRGVLVDGSIFGSETLRKRQKRRATN